MFYAVFSGIVTAVAAWSIWGQDMFPREADPTGSTCCQDLPSDVTSLNVWCRSRNMVSRWAEKMASKREFYSWNSAFFQPEKRVIPPWLRISNLPSAFEHSDFILPCIWLNLDWPLLREICTQIQRTQRSSYWKEWRQIWGPRELDLKEEWTYVAPKRVVVDIINVSFSCVFCCLQVQVAQIWGHEEFSH